MDLLTVEQVANELNISKVTVYNKLKLKELRHFKVNKNGKLYIQYEALEAIKLTLKPYFTIKLKEEPINADNSNDIKQLFKDEIALLSLQVKNLNDQIERKDLQLLNMQQLLKKEQERNLLNSVGKELSIDLEKNSKDKEIENNTKEEEVSVTEEKGSFFSKIFRRR